MIRRSLPAVLVLFLVAAGMLWSCSGSGITVGRYAFDLTLDDLPDSATMRGHYEGWAVGGDGVARSTGAFIIQGSDATAVVSSPNGARLYGTRALATFGPSSTQMGDNFPFIVNAHWFFITLEPEGDHDAVPSCQVLLAGAFVGNGLVLSTDAVAVNAGVDCGQVIGGTTYLGLGDVAAATGTCVMGSPTDADPVNDHAGVWFANAASVDVSVVCRERNFVAEVEQTTEQLADATGARPFPYHCVKAAAALLDAVHGLINLTDHDSEHPHLRVLGELHDFSMEV